MVDLQANLPEFSPRDLVAVLFKRKRPILACYVAMVAVTATYCFFWPPTYEAHVRLLLKHDRQEPLITADPQSVRMVARAVVAEEDLNSETAVLQSRAVLENTVRDLRLDAQPAHWAARVLNLPRAGISALYNSYHQRPAQTAFGQAVTKLHKSLIVVPEKKSAILGVRLRWGSPDRAATILERLTSNYIAVHLAVRKEPAVQEFFRSQAETKKAELAAIENEIQRVRSGTSSGVIEYERQLAIGQAFAFEAEWRKAQAQVSQMRARVEGQVQELQTVPPRVVTEDRPSPALDQLKQRVIELELRRNELLQKYQADHRLVLDTEDELRRAQDLLGQTQSDVYSARTTDVNPVASTIGKDLSSDRAQLRSLEALAEATQKETNAYRAKANGLKRDALLVQRLERDRRAAEDSYLQYLRRYEEARVEDEMNARRLVNVTPIEPVRAGLTPVKPDARLLLRLVLVLGLILSVGLGFALELLDHRLKSQRDVENYLRIPVLGTLDRHDGLEAPVSSRR